MNVEKMTVHGALCELKVLQQRIDKETASAVFVFVNKHSASVSNGVPVSEKEDQIKAEFDSISSLIKRRNAIKKAVIASNAVTEIQVGEQKMLVSEGIDLKNTGLPFKKKLVDRMNQQYSNAVYSLQSYNNDAERKAMDSANATFAGSDKPPAEFEAHRKNVLSALSYDLHDPLNLPKRIKELEAEIVDFEKNLDSALAVSNAITTIEVCY